MNDQMTIYLKRTKNNEEIKISLKDDDHSFIVGRSKECDYTISGNPMISRQHIEITARDGKLYVGDLGSKFRTFLDDKQVTDPVEISASQILKLADELFTVESDHNRDTTSQENTQEGPLCPICHSPLSENDKFCTTCGSFIG